MIKNWKSTQQIIALCSAEAELYAVLKVASQALGLVNMGRDFKLNLSVIVHSDSSAALAIS